MNNHTDVLVVLGGGLVKKNGRWRTPDFNGSDNFGICGSRLRVIAAGFLYKKNPKQLIIASGGKGQLKDILPASVTLAGVIKRELVKLGIPAKKIFKEEKSNNTYQQLKRLQKIFKNRTFRNVVIISNRYHLPRLRAMIKYAGDLRPFRKMLSLSKVKIKSAEGIIMKYKPEFRQKIISKIYKSKAMKKRIKLENQGAEQIRRGVYRFK